MSDVGEDDEDDEDAGMRPVAARACSKLRSSETHRSLSTDGVCLGTLAV